MDDQKTGRQPCFFGSLGNRSWITCSKPHTVQQLARHVQLHALQAPQKELIFNTPHRPYFCRQEAPPWRNPEVIGGLSPRSPDFIILWALRASPSALPIPSTPRAFIRGVLPASAGLTVMLWALEASAANLHGAEDRTPEYWTRQKPSIQYCAVIDHTILF